MSAPNFKTVLASVRPVRIAVLIDQQDEDWQATCLRVIEFLSTVWGGSYNIIIPTDGTSISETFWQILDAFDPDYFFFYYKTGADLKINHPEKYKEWLEKTTQNYLSNTDATDIDNARLHIDERLLEHHFTPDLPETLQLQLKKRLAPFHFKNHAIEQGIGVGAKARYPLAPLANVLPNTEHAKQLMRYRPLYGGVFPLWLASITGLTGDSFGEIISAQNMVPFECDNYEALKFVMRNGKLDSNSEEDTITPFDLTNVNLSLYRSKNASPYRGPLVVVTGDTVFDFCLYYALSRLRNMVIWMPSDWLKSEPGNLFKEFAYNLARLEFSIDTHPKAIFISHSLGQPEMETLIEELRQSGWYRGEGEARLSLEKVLDHPLRMYERDNVDMASSVMIREGAYIDIFNTLKPKNFRKLDPYEHRWITEVHIINHQLPRHFLLGDWVVRHPIITAKTARISSRGISFFCPNSSYFGGDIDTTLVRPTLFIPTAYQIFEHILKKEGYSVAFSDKGIYAQKTLDKLGTLEVFGSVLRNENYRNVLFKYLDKTKPDRGVHDEGCYLTDRRRYLNFPSIIKTIGNAEKSQQTVEILLRLGILYRGYVLKCGICKDAAWFGLDEVAQIFKCKRCSSAQYITHENYWYDAYEPGLYYKLDEIVYQFIQHNGYVATLALGHLRMRSENSFLFTSDLELIKSGTNSTEERKELDILCIQDGVLTLGEAKKENRLGNNANSEVNEIRKYFSLAQEIGAKALVFATFSEAWAPETLNNIKRIVTDNSINIITLTQQELLSD